MGRDLQNQAAHRSQMLQQPIKELSKHGEDGTRVDSSWKGTRDRDGTWREAHAEVNNTDTACEVWVFSQSKRLTPACTRSPR